MRYEIDANSLVERDGKTMTIYNSTDLTKIIIYATPNRLKDTATRPFPFEDYHLVKIQLKNGTEITIISLFLHNLDKQIQKNFKDVTIDKIPSLFPLISK